jgi:hypothetical protein
MNEPAFPRPASAAHAHGMHSPQEGMTLRDYFAAKAMQGLIAHEQKASHLSGANIGDFDVRVAFAAYRYADAMMSRREA